jgi:hypothetical protein
MVALSWPTEDIYAVLRLTRSTIPLCVLVLPDPPPEIRTQALKVLPLGWWWDPKIR